ncbi:MAG: hypothetical protein ACI9WO_002070 [Sphingobacteriales bacterium]|jgi:hypothetical protein
MKTVRLLILAIIFGGATTVAIAQVKSMPQKAEATKVETAKQDDASKKAAEKAKADKEAEMKNAADIKAKAAAEKAKQEKAKAKAKKKSSKPKAAKKAPVVDNSPKLNTRSAKKEDSSKMTIQQKMKIVSDLMTESDTILSRVDKKIEKNKVEITDRLTILIYHKGNMEVTDSTNAAIARFLKNNEDFRAQLNEVKIKWQDEAKKLSSIYTEYGEKRQPSTPGSEPIPTEFDGFVDKHQKFLRLIEKVEEGMQYVEKESAYLESVNG